MSVTSVQEFIKVQLDGLPMPVVDAYAIPSLFAIVSPPTVGDYEGPQAYIKASRFSEKRLSQPPGTGTKRRDYQVDVVLRWIIDVGPLSDMSVEPADVWSGIVDTTLDKLNHLPKQVYVQDAITGKFSKIGLAGDAMTGRIEGPWSIMDQRQQIWGSPLVVNIVELFAG